MGKVEIEELGEKSIAEILTLVANPPSLEDKLVEKDMRNLSTAEQDVVKEIYRRKVENVKVQRDEILQYAIGGLFPKRENVKSFEIETYKQLFDTILSPKFMTKSLLDMIDETETRAKTLGESHGSVSLREVISNYRRGDNPSWLNTLKKKKVGLTIYKNPCEESILYVQTKNKTPERQRAKVTRGIIESLENDKEVKASLDDVAAFMLITKFYHDPTSPYSDPNSGKEEQIMNIISNKLHVSDKVKLSDFENCYTKPDVGQNMIKMYLQSSTWDGGYPKLNKEYGLINVGGNIINLATQNEKISVHLKDVTNAMEDEIGLRSHTLYEHRQNKDLILKDEEAQKYMERMKRFQTGVEELKHKEDIPWT